MKRAASSSTVTPLRIRRGALMLCLIVVVLLLTEIVHSLSSAQMNRYIAIYKPALVLCTFNDDGTRVIRKNRRRRLTLAHFGLPPRLHLVGRLDRDSEGLLLLTDNGRFTHRVLSQDCHKTYWTLVQGIPNDAALEQMRQGGLEIRGAFTRPPLQVRRLNDMPSILPPACLGMDRPGTWLEIVLNEGRNRQVRRLTAAAGHPTIRLVRVAIGAFTLLENPLKPGELKYIKARQVLP